MNPELKSSDISELSESLGSALRALQESTRVGSAELHLNISQEDGSEVGVAATYDSSIDDWRLRFYDVPYTGKGEKK